MTQQQICEKLAGETIRSHITDFYDMKFKFEMALAAGYEIHRQEIANITARKVIAIKDGKEIEYPSISAAARKIEVNHTSIYKVLIGENKTCKSFKWRYKK